MSKAGARAAQRKKMQSPVLASAEVTDITPSQARKVLTAIAEPRVLSTTCFATAGLLAGLVTGLNHFPSLGNVGPVAKTMLLAAYLGDPHLDIASGIGTAFAGVVIGGCLGFSALSDAKDLGIGVLTSTILAGGALVYTGNVWLIGLAFLLGHVPTFLAYRRLQQA